MSTISSCLGFPRIGVARELKKSLESFWSRKSSAEDLLKSASELRKRHWLLMKESGVDHIPSNDFSLYDHMLDMAITIGAIPKRYQQIKDPLDQYFAMARGLQDREKGIDIAALEMTKWFDTNYHYIVPEIDPTHPFKLDASKIISELKEARALGIEVRPVIPGPITFLLLAKAPQGVSTIPLDRLDDLLPTYAELLEVLATNGVNWVQLDEPCLVLDLDKRTKEAYKKSFVSLIELSKRPKIMLTTYFGSLGSNLNLAAESGCEGLHIDLVRGRDQLDTTLSKLRPKTLLSLGLINGRNIWRADLHDDHALIRKAIAVIGEDRVLVSTSCSLLHTPVDLLTETTLDAEIKSWLAFATQKISEIRALADSASLPQGKSKLFEEAKVALQNRKNSPRSHNKAVRARIKAITESMLHRAPYEIRAAKQRSRFKLPILPTTTIGSFPQTSEVRAARAAWRAGHLTDAAYNDFLRQETQNCVKRQESLGLDVLVHGEFERNDMVEYFGEQLEGFLFTKNGWVQSYGSRCVKPPVIFGDVSRPKPMTVEWSSYAQSLTNLPMKGMLTGPVTVLQWSFARDDQPRSDTCMQIGLALRDEVSDLEAAGIAMIQVDEPAIREGLPLRRSEWQDYLKWAIEAFRLSTSGISSETQIHTHMCYSEFGDMLDAIAALDADVLSIETSRSKMEILGDFGHFKYPNEVGPGVYDIHSPRVPTKQEMEEQLLLAAKVLPADRLWVNPDCGLKTRGWPEVESALASMSEAARSVRKILADEKAHLPKTRPL